MLNYIVNSGVSSKNHRNLNQRITICNFIALEFGSLSILFSIFVFLYYPSLLLFPTLFQLFSLIIILLNRFGYYALSRMMLCIVLPSIYVVVASYLNPDHQPIYASLYALLIVFWIPPWMVFNLDEKIYLIVGVTFYVFLSISFPEINNYFTYEADTASLETGPLSYLLYSIALIAITGGLFSAQYQFFVIRKKSDSLIFEITSKNQEFELQNEEIRQQQEEMAAQRDFIEKQNKELQLSNQKMKTNEDILKKAYDKLKATEENLQLQKKELEDHKAEMISQNEELIIGQEELKAQRDYIEKQNEGLQLSNQKMKANEEILKKAYQKLKDSEDQIKLQKQELEEKQAEILTQNEELMQSQEELTAQRDFIEKQNQELQLSNQKMKTNADILQKAYQKLKDSEDQIKLQKQELEEQKAEIMTQNEELFQSQEELTAQRDFIEKQNQELQLSNQRMKANEEILKKAYSKLKDKEEEIRKTNLELEERDRQISSSIKSALTIQQAILPYKEKLDALLNEYFLIYSPKDIVSGDFYWLNQVDNRIVLASVDCTGHGVPGAFMSLIGNTLLDKIVRVWKITDPAEILTRLHEEVQIVLRQQETGNNNGMDLSVIVLETLNQHEVKLIHAGAKSNVYIIKSGHSKIEVLKGQRKSIGGQQNELVSFEAQTEILPVGSLVYMGTDGFADQNDVKRKRIGEKKMISVLEQHKDESMDDQKWALLQLLNGHIEGTTQRDDIFVIGFKIHAF